MSSTFAVRTITLRTTGSGTLTIGTGFKPSFIHVTQEDGIELTHAPGSNTRKRAALGTTTFLTTTGINWDNATASVTLGNDAGLNGTADKLLIIQIYK
jgi:hypothetical protein